MKGEINALVDGTIQGEIQPVKNNLEELDEDDPDRKDVDYEEG